MPWQILISISIFFTSLLPVIQKAILREKIDPLVFSVLFQFITGLLALAYAGFSKTLVIPAAVNNLFLNLLFMAVLYGLGNYFVFQALKHTDASKFALYFSSRIFVTSAASAYLLKEIMSSYQIFGSILIFLSIIILNYNRKLFKFKSEELYSLLAAVCFGLAYTNDKFLLGYFDVRTYTSINFLLPAVFMCSLFIKNIYKGVQKINKIAYLKIIFLCFLCVISVLTFFDALQKSSNSAQLVSISLFSVVLTVFLSIFMLKETDGLFKKITAALISFAGLLLLN